MLAFVCAWGYAQVDTRAYESELSVMRTTPLVHVARLDWMAEKYVMQMAYVKSTSHDLIVPSVKLKWATWAEAVLPIKNDKYDLYELNAAGDPKMSMYHLAHIFDDSPYHAWVIHNPRALWYGYATTIGYDGRLYLCVYVVVLYINVDMEALR